MKNIRQVYVVGGARIPFAKSMTAYKEVPRQELMVAALRSLNAKFGLGDQPLGDVALGALMNSSADWNLARESVQGAGLHPETPAYNVQRACGTSLETTIQIANKIALGQIEDGVAGGVDTNSDLPIEVSKELRGLLLEVDQQRSTMDKISTLAKFRPSFLKPNPPTVSEPRTGLSMGAHCELMIKEWKVTRLEQDQLAYASHINATQAYERGFYKDLVYPFVSADAQVEKDGFVRPDTTVEKLGKLKPAFDKITGSLTAGNSSPLTDGAAAVLLASDESVKAHGWKPLARVVDGQSAAVDYVGGEGLLMAPVQAVAKLLKRNGLKLQDFDYYEIHEAFAAQVLCTLKAWESEEYCQKHLGTAALGSIDRAKLNVVGSSVALGHPFAATGARIVATAAKLLSEGDGDSAKAPAANGTKRRALISICTAGGMGVAMILESV